MQDGTPLILVNFCSNKNTALLDCLWLKIYLTPKYIPEQIESLLHVTTFLFFVLANKTPTNKQRKAIEIGCFSFSYMESKPGTQQMSLLLHSMQYSNESVTWVLSTHRHTHKAKRKIWARKSWSSKMQVQLYYRRQSSSALKHEYQHCKLIVNSRHHPWLVLTVYTVAKSQ
jgi:hypothetical protein